MGVKDTKDSRNNDPKNPKKIDLHKWLDMVKEKIEVFSKGRWMH